jgi:small-conductance mechanosensitive channel
MTFVLPLLSATVFTVSTPAPAPVSGIDAFFASKLWSTWGEPIHIVAIIVIAFLVRIVLRFVINRVVDRIVNGVKKRHELDDTQAVLASPLNAVRVVQRTRTLGSVLNNIVSAVIIIVALLLIVSTLDANITASFALITGALGAGLGFGAQNIVKDVLNGLFMVAEDQYGVGDVVDVGAATGVVEAVGIRVTQIRDVNGTVWFCRNGEILRVGNMSQGWSRVITDIAVPYDTDVQQVQATMLATATDMATNSKWRARVVDRPEIWGIESISADNIVIRLVVKTRPGSKDDVARELRVRLKDALDAMGVQLPSLATVVLSGFDGAESVRGAHPPRTTPNPIVTTEDPKPPRGRAAKTAKPPATSTGARTERKDPRATTLPIQTPKPEQKKPTDD